MAQADRDQGGILSATHILEYPYTRSVGPFLGRFLTALKEGLIVGNRMPSGKVVVPPSEFDPDTAEDAGADFVEVGPGGSVSSWTWVTKPREKQPLEGPFAWGLILLDGADTPVLHAVDAGRESLMATGMRVTARWKEQREGMITDIECFEPEESG